MFFSNTKTFKVLFTDPQLLPFSQNILVRSCSFPVAVFHRHLTLLNHSQGSVQRDKIIFHLKFSHPNRFPFLLNATCDCRLQLVWQRPSPMQTQHPPPSWRNEQVNGNELIMRLGVRLIWCCLKFSFREECLLESECLNKCLLKRREKLSKSDYFFLGIAAVDKLDSINSESINF